MLEKVKTIFGMLHAGMLFDKAGKVKTLEESTENLKKAVEVLGGLQGYAAYQQATSYKSNILGAGATSIQAYGLMAKNENIKALDFLKEWLSKSSFPNGVLDKLSERSKEIANGHVSAGEKLVRNTALDALGKVKSMMTPQSYKVNYGAFEKSLTALVIENPILKKNGSYVGESVALGYLAYLGGDRASAISHFKNQVEMSGSEETLKNELGYKGFLVFNKTQPVSYHEYVGEMMYELGLTINAQGSSNKNKPKL